MMTVIEPRNHAEHANQDALIRSSPQQVARPGIAIFVLYNHSIDYVVIGHSGLTSSSTRIVIVSPPANDNSPLPDLQATGTDATTTAP
jgi:hypothetical protein